MELWLDRAARERPDAPAVNGYTYAALAEGATRGAQALAALGVEARDRVATTFGGIHFAALLHALQRLGAVLVPLDPRLTPTERERVLADAAPKLVLDEPIRSDGVAVEMRTEAAQDEPLAVVHTSGTTGAPKPVELTYGNFEASAAAHAANLGVEPDDVWLCVLPLFHVAGLSILTRSAIYRTAALVHERFDAHAVNVALMDGGVTLVSLVATQLRRLLDAGLRRPPRLRAALIGGGPVPADLIERARERGVPVVPTYGMTETCSQIWTGGPLPGVEIRVSEEGELLVRGAMVAPGAVAEDGWLHTGDRGRIDPDGTLHVEGRIADTIVTGGENVAAAEVEEALLAYPGVADAAVVGRPDREWGEAVIAYVVADGVSAQELIDHCRTRLAPYKVPKAVYRIDEIPRSGAGKVLRGRLGEAPPA